MSTEPSESPASPGPPAPRSRGVRAKNVSSLLDGRAFQRDPLSYLRSLDPDREVLPFRVGPSRFTILRGPRMVEKVLVRDRRSFGEGKWTRRGRWLLGDCLITREGEPHLERRRVLQPVFSRTRLEEKATGLARRIDAWVAARSEGPIECLHTEMAEIAALATCWALFDRDLVECGVDPNRVARDISTLVNALPLHWLFGSRALPARRRLRRVARLVLEEAEGGSNDLARTMREAGLDMAAMVREVIAFLVAGIDTTPRTLSCLWYQISIDPDLESRLHREVDAAWKSDPRPDAARSVDFVHCLVLETERMFPAVRFIDRRPLHDLEIDGVLLPKDSNVLVSPLVAHRDASHFEDPDVFRPQRWSDDQEAPRGAYIPFGLGVHRCIGEWLARITIPTLAVATARRWRIVCQPPARPPNQEFTRFRAVRERR